jgi:hypothetical protein
MTHALLPETMHDQTAPILLAVALVLAVFGFVWLMGSTDRVTYLGPDHGRAQTVTEVNVKTEPYGLYILQRNDAYRSMKIGCRYDFTYSPTFGRTRGRPSGLKTKLVRSARLVDCP